MIVGSSDPNAVKSYNVAYLPPEIAVICRCVKLLPAPTKLCPSPPISNPTVCASLQSRSSGMINVELSSSWVLTLYSTKLPSPRRSAYIYTYIRCTNVCIYIYIYFLSVYIYINIYTYVYIYIYMYTY